MQFPAEWWEDEQVYHPITEYDLEMNEVFNPTLKKQKPAFMPKRIDATKQELPEDVDEDTTWYDTQNHEEKTFMTMVNDNRKTIESGQQVYRGFDSQLWHNRFLLRTFGICPAENRFEYYEVHFRTQDINLDATLVPAEVVDWKQEHEHTAAIRFGKDQINDLLLCYLRSMCSKVYAEDRPKSSSKSISLSRPRRLLFEIYIFEKYLSILEYLQTELAKVSTLENDIEILNDANISFEMRQVVTYRAEKKRILRSQIHLVKKVLDVLNNAEATLKKTKNVSDEERCKNYQ